MSKVPFGVKSVLNNPSLKGIEGTIGSLINTELSYSEAINTALQASANNIVTTNDTFAKEAIDYLKELIKEE